jgi:hypothetical protein
MRRPYLAPLLVFALLILGTVLVVLYGKGYRIGNLSNGKPTISKTGLLVATSNPDGAQVFINGNLTTATDDTIDLLPGEYDIKITKEGYFPWEKHVRIQKEVVTKADALLFPTAPRLESITASGVESPVIDPARRKIAFRIASQSAKKNGMYVLDMSSYPVLTLQSSAKQISDDTTALFSASSYEWSPDGEELLASISATPIGDVYYLLRSSGFNDAPKNVTAILQSVYESWTTDSDEKNTARLASLKKDLRQMIGSNFVIKAWSPDETKILYIASRSAELPFIIKPRHIGLDLLREQRTIEKNDMYIYDIADDTNMKILNASATCSEDASTCFPPVQWFPDSEHLILIQDGKINIMEDDGTNTTTIYAGPFINSYVFPWPNGSKIVILTNFNNPGVPPNLYTIGLK